MASNSFDIFNCSRLVPLPGYVSHGLNLPHVSVCYSGPSKYFGYQSAIFTNVIVSSCLWSSALASQDMSNRCHPIKFSHYFCDSTWSPVITHSRYVPCPMPLHQEIICCARLQIGISRKRSNCSNAPSHKCQSIFLLFFLSPKSFLSINLCVD